MTCSRCESVLRDNALFCTVCGLPANRMNPDAAPERPETPALDYIAPLIVTEPSEPDTPPEPEQPEDAAFTLTPPDSWAKPHAEPDTPPEEPPRVILQTDLPDENPAQPVFTWEPVPPPPPFYPQAFPGNPPMPPMPPFPPYSPPAPPSPPSSVRNAPSSVRNAPLKLGDFVLAELIAWIPAVNLIVFLVWMFSKNGNKNRIRLAQAKLLTAFLIGLGVAAALAVLAALTAAGVIDGVRLPSLQWN